MMRRVDAANYYKVLPKGMYGMRGIMDSGEAQTLDELLKLETEEQKLYEIREALTFTSRADGGLGFGDTPSPRSPRVAPAKEAKDLAARGSPQVHHVVEQDRKRRLLSMTPLNHLISASSRDDMLNKVICRQDRACTALFMLAEGLCELHLHNDKGDVIISRSLQPGEWFPCWSLIANLPAAFTVVSLKACSILKLPAVHFKSEVAPLLQDEFEANTRCLQELFTGLTPADAVRLLSLSKIRKERRGATIVEQGVVAQEVVLLVSGECQVFKNNMQISTVSAPHLFGEMSVATNLPTATRTTSHTDVRTLSLSKHDMTVLLRELASMKCVGFGLLQSAAQIATWQYSRYAEGYVVQSVAGLTSTGQTSRAAGGRSSRFFLPRRRTERPKSALELRHPTPTEAVRSSVRASAAKEPVRPASAHPSASAAKESVTAAKEPTRPASAHPGGTQSASSLQQHTAAAPIDKSSRSALAQQLDRSGSTNPTTRPMSTLPLDRSGSMRPTTAGGASQSSWGEAAEAPIQFNRTLPRASSADPPPRPTSVKSDEDSKRNLLVEGGLESINDEEVRDAAKELDLLLGTRKDPLGLAAAGHKSKYVSLAAANKKNMDKPFAAFLHNSEMVRVMEDKWINKSFLARLHNSYAQREVGKAYLQMRREVSFGRDTAPIGTRAKRLKLKLGNKYAGGFKLPEDGLASGDED